VGSIGKRISREVWVEQRKGGNYGTEGGKKRGAEPGKFKHKYQEMYEWKSGNHNQKEGVITLGGKIRGEEAREGSGPK